MNTKVKGFVLSTNDYQDADKLASFFSYELGVITVKFGGVKKQNAKYKMVCQPFCLCELDIAKKNTFYTVTSATIMDTHYDLLKDYDKTICAFIVADIIRTVLPKEKAEPEGFVFALQALMGIQESAFVGLKNFMLRFLQSQGMEVSIGADSKFIYLDKYEGDIVTERNQNTVSIDKKVYDFLSSDEPTDRKIMLSACRLLNTIFTIKLDIELKTFAQLM